MNMNVDTNTKIQSGPNVGQRESTSLVDEALDIYKTVYNVGRKTIEQDMQKIRINIAKTSNINELRSFLGERLAKKEEIDLSEEIKITNPVTKKSESVTVREAFRKVGARIKESEKKITTKLSAVYDKELANLAQEQSKLTELDITQIKANMTRYNVNIDLTRNILYALQDQIKKAASWR